MEKQVPKSVTIQIRTTPALKKLAQRGAKKACRSLTSYVERLIVDANQPKQGEGHHA